MCLTQHGIPWFHSAWLSLLGRHLEDGVPVDLPREGRVQGCRGGVRPWWRWFGSQFSATLARDPPDAELGGVVALHDTRNHA